MQKTTLTIKDDSKFSFLVGLLKQVDFIEICAGKNKQNEDYDFFASSGMWKGRNDSAGQLRKV